MPAKTDKGCSVEGCEAKHVGLGLCSTHYGRQWREKNRDLSRASAQRTRWRARYGMSEAEVLALRARGCDVCGDTTTIYIDHDHDRNGRDSVRGALCARCNTLEGYLRKAEEEGLLDPLQRYLDAPPGIAPRTAVIAFEPESHTYTLDGVPVPSVTEIIKQTVPVPFERSAWYGYRLAQQGRRMDQTRNEAAIRGTKIHKAFEEYANGGSPDAFDYPDCEGFLQAIESFVEQNDPDFHDAEVWTASTKYQYAGTMDAFCTFRAGKHKGASARMDLKTGRYYADSHGPQLLAYEQAEIERGKGKSDLRFVLDVKPTGKYILRPISDTFADFKVLLDHYRSVVARKARSKKK